MTCHTVDATNTKLADVRGQLLNLIRWAEDDAQHAREHNAPWVARDDTRRRELLFKTYHILGKCMR